MKTVLTKFLVISSASLLMLASCKKEGTKVMATAGTPGDLTVNSTTVDLNKAMINDTTTVVKFNFSKATFGFNAAVTNTLQIDAASDNWANPTTFTLPNGTYSQGFSTGVFNALLLKLNLPTGVASPINVRVAHSLAANVPPVYSNTLSLSATPFNLVSYVYVPGNYEGSSWPNPGPQEDSLQSATSNGIFVGVIPIKLVSDQFLITPAKNWNNKYATTAGAGAAGGTITYPTVYGNSGNNFYAASKATIDPAVFITSNYAVLNTNNNTLTLTPTLWSVVGDATPGSWPASSGYQSDTDMSFNNGTQTWSVTVNLTAGGNIKFRLNHDWNTNLGGSNGTLTSGGANIPIATAGTYKITLDVVNSTYTLVKQ